MEMPKYLGISHFILDINVLIMYHYKTLDQV